MNPNEVEIAEAYQAHGDAMHRVAYATLRDAGLGDESADVVMNVVVELLSKPPTGVKNWEAFLVTMVRRRALDLLRSAEVRHRSGGEVDLEGRPGELDLLGDLEDGLDTLALMAKAVDALNSLEPNLRHVAYEFFWVQRKQIDIASELGLTQARVSQMITEARRQMKAEMQGGAE